jgi:hypothetical protein
MPNSARVAGCGCTLFPWQQGRLDLNLRTGEFVQSMFNFGLLAAYSDLTA